MTDEVVSESLRYPFANDFDDGSIGPGRISAMSVEDDGSSFILSQSFGGSTVTELSSVFSMSEDDFDKMASRHARFLFDEIDSMLYEHETSGPPYLIKECHEWRAEFPHLRVLGHQVIDRQEEGFHLYPAMSLVPNGMEVVSRTTESKDLLVHGKNFDADRLNVGVGSLGLSHPEGMVPLEEVLEENGTMEEILAIDYKTGEDECQKLGPNKQFNGRPPITPFNCVKDNIISALFNHVLREVMPAAKPLLERLLANAGGKGMPEELSCGEPTDDLELSLLSNRYSEKNSRSSAFGTSVLSAVPEDTPLGGLLTIRSKTLLNRERTMGLLDGITENLQSQTTVPSIRLNPVMFGSGHLPERRSSLNRIKLLPLENTRLQSLPPGEVDHVTNANLDGLRGHRFATLTSQSSSTPTPKLPPLQNQRTIMSANVPNTNINRSMQQRSKLVDVAKRWRPGSTESTRSDRPKLRPFYCHPVAKTLKLSREPVEYGRDLTKPASSQPVARSRFELHERHRQKSNLESPNSSGPSISWNDPNQVRAPKKKCVSDLVSVWVEQHKLSLNIPGAHGHMNAPSTKNRHIGFCDEGLQNFIGKTCTYNHTQMCDVDTYKCDTKLEKNHVDSIQSTKMVGSDSDIDSCVRKPCSKMMLKAPIETPESGLGDVFKGSWIHEAADSSRRSQKTKIGSFFIDKLKPDGEETLTNTELWVQDGRIQVGSTAQLNNSVKDVCRCKRLLGHLPSKLPRPCSVKKDSCGDLGNSEKLTTDRVSNGRLPDISDAGFISQNARKVGKAGNSAVMWPNGQTDSEFHNKASSGFFDKVKLSVRAVNRGFDKGADNKIDCRFLDRADNRVSPKIIRELSVKAKHNFHPKNRDFDKADDDKADSGFFDKASVGFSDKAGYAFHDKAKYRDYDKADGDKDEGDKAISGILENVGSKSAGYANFKLRDKANKKLHSTDNTISADKFSSRVFDKTSSRLTNELLDNSTGVFMDSRFSDKAASRSNKTTGNRLFDETSIKSNSIVSGKSIPKDHSTLIDETNKAQSRLIDVTKSRSGDKDCSSRLIYKTNQAKSRLIDNVKHRSNDNDHCRLIHKADKAKSRVTDKAEDRPNDNDCYRLTDKASNRSRDKDHSRLIDEYNKAKSRLTDEGERRSNDKGKSRSIDKGDKANSRVTDTGSDGYHHCRLTDKSNSTLIQNCRGASLVPRRRLTDVPEKQDNGGNTKTDNDNTVNAVATHLQSSNMSKACSSVRTKIQRTEHIHSLVNMKNATAKSHSLVTPKICKGEKPGSSFTFLSHKTGKTESPVNLVVLENSKDKRSVGSSSSSFQKTGKTEKANSVTPKYYKDEKFCKYCVPVSSRNKTLGQYGKHSPSRIPRPVEEPTRQHVSEISQLTEVIPKSWAHAMQPFLEILKMSGKEMPCRKDIGCPCDKMNQRMRSRIPRPYSVL